MDDLTRRQRHNEPSAHHAQAPGYGLRDDPRHSRPIATTANDRYRPSAMSSAATTSRGVTDPGAYGNYYQEPTSSFSATNMPSNSMGYSPEYNSSSRPAQGQVFGAYGNTGMMYNLPQPGTSQTPVYEGQTFGQRQSTALQMMAPDVASSYFSHESSSATNLQHAESGSGSTQSNMYPSSHNMGYSNSIPASNMVQENASGADVAMGDDHEYSENGLEEKWLNYQRQLATIFQDIISGSLDSASDTLLTVSGWLLSQVADLGLHLDDANLHADRIKLWNDFNHAWLGLAFKQRELMASGMHPSQNPKMLSEDKIQKMGDELIRLCDGIERHGLVDYQYGVWEDQIESILEDCLDQFESAGDVGRDRSQ